MSMPRAAMSVATSARNLALLEAVERRLARVLGLVAVDGRGLDAALLQDSATRLAPCFVRVNTSARSTRASSRIQLEGAGACLPSPRSRHLVDGFAVEATASTATSHGLMQQRVGQGPDAVRHGGRKEQGLAHLGHLRSDALDVVDEAHVEHAIGFVEHEHARLRTVSTRP